MQTNTKTKKSIIHTRIKQTKTLKTKDNKSKQTKNLIYRPNKKIIINNKTQEQKTK